MTGLTHNNFKISGRSERAKKTVSDFEISFLLSICLSGGERWAKRKVRKTNTGPALQQIMSGEWQWMLEK